jgi:hypothetical protein
MLARDNRAVLELLDLEGNPNQGHWRQIDTPRWLSNSRSLLSGRTIDNMFNDARPGTALATLTMRLIYAILQALRSETFLMESLV